MEWFVVAYLCPDNENKRASTTVFCHKPIGQTPQVTDYKEQRQEFELNEHHQITDLIEMVCGTAGMPGMAQEIKVEWSNKMTRCAGKAYLQRKLIRLSNPIWALAGNLVNEETVVHETCHILVYWEWANRTQGRLKSADSPPRPHGSEWQRLMRKCGYEPKRCHSVDTSTIRPKRKRYRFDCGCKEGHLVSRQLLAKIRAGKQYVCRLCRKKITRPLNEQVVFM